MENEIIELLKELNIQTALGTVPDKYKNNLIKNYILKTTKGRRHCHFCRKSIEKDGQYYRYSFMNICIDCSWLSIQSILRIFRESKQKSNK